MNYFYLIIIAALCIALFMKKRKAAKNEANHLTPTEPAKQQESAPEANTPDVESNEAPDAHASTEGYQQKYLLTKYEWQNYKLLRDFAAKNHLIICPKIRLADLVEPKTTGNRSEWQKMFNRIKSKHVDFVLCDQDMRVKLIVELDDCSHEKADRQARDAFVDEVLQGAGYKIVHIKKFDKNGHIMLWDALHSEKKSETSVTTQSSKPAETP